MKNYNILNINLLIYTIIILILRYFYLEYIHENLYEYTNGYYNGYVVSTILLWLLKVRYQYIFLFLIGRYIYRCFFNESYTNNSLDPSTNIVFGVCIYLCLLNSQK